MSSSSIPTRRFLSPLIQLYLALFAFMNMPISANAALTTSRTINPRTSTNAIFNTQTQQLPHQSPTPLSRYRATYSNPSFLHPPTFRHSSPTVLSAKRSTDSDDDTPKDPTAFLGNFRLVVPALFLAQIVFLAVAQSISGADNLENYGNLGNQYIRENGGWDQSKGIFERQAITSAGQQIWFNNVIRDLKNGAPVYPPLTKP